MNKFPWTFRVNLFLISFLLPLSQHRIHLWRGQAHVWLELLCATIVWVGRLGILVCVPRDVRHHWGATDRPRGDLLAAALQTKLECRSIRRRGPGPTTNGCLLLVATAWCNSKPARLAGLPIYVFLFFETDFWAAFFPPKYSLLSITRLSPWMPFSLMTYVFVFFSTLHLHLFLSPSLCFDGQYCFCPHSIAMPDSFWHSFALAQTALCSLLLHMRICGCCNTSHFFSKNFIINLYVFWNCWSYDTLKGNLVLHIKSFIRNFDISHFLEKGYKIYSGHRRNDVSSSSLALDVVTLECKRRI